jgi:hypothetical protein
VAGWPNMVASRLAHVAIAPLLCPKGVVVELKRMILEGKGRKDGEDGLPATNLWPTGQAWPTVNPYFHSPLHLAPIKLTPLTTCTKSKANSFHPFPKFLLFIYSLKFLILYYAMMK